MYRSSKYLDFVRSKGFCLRCGYEISRPNKEDDNPITVHHVPLKQAGTAIKAPDSQVVNLCARCHQLEESTPDDEFWGGIDPKMEIIKLLTEYLEVKGI